MRKHNVSTNLVCAIENLYGKAISAVQMIGNTGVCFRTTTGIGQGCFRKDPLQHFSRQDYILSLQGYISFDLTSSSFGKNMKEG